MIRGTEIKDAAALQEYVALWPPMAARYGAEIIAGKGEFDTREGPHYSRQMLVRFDSYALAIACYEDPEYQAALKLVQQAYERELSILEG